jgi:hypothetical protein
LAVGSSANNLSLYEISLRKRHNNLGRGRILWIRDLSDGVRT